MSISTRIALALVRGYQLLLAPYSGGGCRFHPSCSVYAAEALAGHGAVRGSWLVLRRLTRCHPLASPGIDPVPPRPAQDAR